MEINNLPQTNSAFLDHRFSSEQKRKNGVFADYFISSTQLLNQANNFVMILSPEGKIKSVSNSFANFKVSNAVCIIRDLLLKKYRLIRL